MPCLQRQARNHEDIDVCIVYLLFCTVQSHVHVCMAIFEILPFYGILVLLLNVYMTILQQEFLWSCSLSGIMT